MPEITSNHKSIKQQLLHIDFPQLLRKKIIEKRFSLSTLSTHIGKHYTYFQRQVDNTDHQVSLLIAASVALNTNLLEPFVNVLPEELRGTQREKDLNKQMDDLKKQMEDLRKQMDDIAKERDIYKNIVLHNKS